MPESYAPQRVVSLQPSVTVTLRDLGALNRLVACTKYCVDICPEVRETGCLIVEDSWSAKAEQILAAKPDLVIASVPYRLESVAEIIKCGIPFLGLAPRKLDDIYKDIMMISQMLGLERWRGPLPGRALIDRMEKTVQAMWQKTMGMARPLVYCEEWGKPLILSQPWVAELVEAAGGRFWRTRQADDRRGSGRCRSRGDCRGVVRGRQSRAAGESGGTPRLGANQGGQEWPPVLHQRRISKYAG